MSTLSTAFEETLAEHAKTAFRQVLAKKPKTTMRELAKLVASNPSLGSMTLGELIGESTGAKKAKKARATKQAATDKRNVRTREGRAAFDAEVLSALKACGGKDLAAAQLRNQLGGADPNQLRTSLNRMIEQGNVTFTGKARATRYSLV